MSSSTTNQSNRVKRLLLIGEGPSIPDSPTPRSWAKDYAATLLTGAFLGLTVALIAMSITQRHTD